MTKAVWEVMREQNFGRIVNISSASGLYGNFGQANYSAAKLGIAGLSFTLSKEGAKRNVLTNVVAPLAASQMTDGIVDDELFSLLKPEHVAPFVACVLPIASFAMFCSQHALMFTMLDWPLARMQVPVPRELDAKRERVRSRRRLGGASALGALARRRVPRGRHEPRSHRGTDRRDRGAFSVGIREVARLPS